MKNVYFANEIVRMGVLSCDNYWHLNVVIISQALFRCDKSMCG
jgi:hypothetical protein